MTKKEFLKYINDGFERGAKTKLAKLLGIKQPSIGEWFAGKTFPSEYSIKKMSALFSMTEEEIREIFNEGKSNSSIVQNNTGNASNNNLNINSTTTDYRFALLEKDLELIKKEIEILKLKIKK